MDQTTTTISIFELPKQTAQALSNGEWGDFLRSAAWNFRFSFLSQMLIYAQRPEATACYTFKDWKKRFNRRIFKDTAQGIALIDDRSDQLALSYVFDYRDTYSDTGENLTPWQLTPEKEKAVRIVLSKTFMPNEPAINDVEPSIYYGSVAYMLMQDELETVLPELDQVIDTCRLQELSREEAERIFCRLLLDSVTNQVMIRCGFEPDLPENAFDDVAYFDSLESMAVLGNATQHITKQILKEIAITVARWDKAHEKREEKEHENERDLSEGRGISNSESGAAGEPGVEQVRTDEEEIPPGTSKERIHSSSDERPTDGIPARNGNEYAGTGGPDGGRLEEERLASAKSGNESGMGASHEDAASRGRGIDSARNDLSLNPPFSEQESLLARQELGETLRTLAFKVDSQTPYVLNGLKQDLRAFVHEHSEKARRSLLEAFGALLSYPSVQGDPETLSALKMALTALETSGRQEGSQELPSAHDVGIPDPFPSDETLDAEISREKESLARDSLNGNPFTGSISAKAESLYSGASDNTPLFSNSVKGLNDTVHSGASQEVPAKNPEPLIDHPELIRHFPTHVRADKDVLSDLILHIANYRSTFFRAMPPLLDHDREAYEQSTAKVYEMLVSEDVDENMAHIQELLHHITTWFVPFSNGLKPELLRAQEELLRRAESLSWDDIKRENEEERFVREEQEVPPEATSEVQPHDSDLSETFDESSFHVGDLYQDHDGKGIITKVTLPEPERRLEGLFSYVDLEAPEGSREASGFVMSMDQAISRLKQREATLTPGDGLQSLRHDHEDEDGGSSLFDFENEAPENVEPEGFETAPARETKPIEPEGRNFRLPALTEPLGGPKTRFQMNMAAIRLLKRLETENRLASPEEQEILSKYVGWGGLADAFDPKSVHWSSEYVELKELLTEEEYAAARESTLTAFYTPPEVINAIYEVLENLGFKRGNILDPGCGIGSFSGRLPDSMSESRIYGIEKDSISGRIARQLYQKNDISIGGYEDSNLPDNFFDVAVGNVPFGNFKVRDKRYDSMNLLIHDYFFAKTLDKLRPGGVMAFITSSGTLDKKSEDFRRYLAQRADLLGAIRLPNNTFKTNAGTDVTSDILFLKKRDIPRVGIPDWVSLDRRYNWETNEFEPEVNAYFAANPEMVLGDLKIVSGPHGPTVACIAREGEDLRKALSDAVQTIHGEMDQANIHLYDQDTEDSADIIPADPDVPNYSFTLVDDEIYFREDSEMHKVTLGKTAEKRVRGMISLRDCLRKLIESQVEGHPDEEIERQQQILNDEYDAFTKKYGLINGRGNAMAFSDDSSYYLLCSLEHINDEGEFLGKADIFTKRTIGSHIIPNHVDTAQEALAISLGERGRIDFPYMTELCGLEKEQLVRELAGQIFEDPASRGKYEIAALYLSGNVREKLDEARDAEEEEPGLWEGNIKALEAVQPKDLEIGDIAVRLGATWVPQEDVTAFMHQLFDTPDWARDRMRVVYSSVIDSWHVNNIDWDSTNTRAKNTYGTGRVNGYHLLEDALNNKDIRLYDIVTDEDGNEHRVLNQNDTLEAQEKQQMIRDAFKGWIFSDPDRAERLCKIYNDKFNSFVPPTFDGDLVRFHNMNASITMRPWQKSAVARILFSGNTLLDHAVGAGKTWTMSAAAMEGKYLGLCQKSMIVVPNHLVGQWASAIYEQYPGAKVLASTKKDFETKNRQKFCSRIATGDYDVVVIGHSQFERIPLSKERQAAGIEAEIDHIIDAIDELKAEHFTIKQMERMKKSLNDRLYKLNNDKRRDHVINFEELGVDRLFVDESHNYKNLFLYTKMQNVAGISQTDSQKASDMFLKCRYMDELTGNKGNIHATGTALSNTMAELYTIQRYLQFDLLQKMGLGTFDQWASTFGETVTSLELAPEGTGYRARTRFAKFFNLPELMSLYCQVADIQTKEMLDLPLPKAKYETIAVPASDIQKDYVQMLAERASKIRNGSVNRNQDNMLNITNDGRKLALDQRLMDPMLPDNPHSKVNACVDKTYELWKKHLDERLTQLIFCDMSTPKPNGFNVYDDIRAKLISKGIPREEVRFIHEAKNDMQKEALFQKVRDGEVRVLLGSTGKLGTGTNVQDRLIAGHDLDCPYRPSDLEQRDGRVIRQGNQNEEVSIFRYVTENTFDAYMYQLLEIKQRFITQIHNPHPTVREAADLDEISMSFAEIKALASGDPRIKERVELEGEVQRLTMLKARHENSQQRLNRLVINELPAKIKAKEKQIPKLQADVERAKEHPRHAEDGAPSLDVKGVTFEKATEAGAAIRAAAEKAPSWENTPIGHFRGFLLIVDKSEKGLSGKPLVQLRLIGADDYGAFLSDSDVGIVLRLNNLLDEDLPEKLQRAEKSLRSMEHELASSKSELGKPFTREEELKEKQKRLDELIKELDLDAAEKVQSKSASSLDHLIQDAKNRQGGHPAAMRQKGIEYERL